MSASIRPLVVFALLLLVVQSVPARPTMRSVSANRSSSASFSAHTSGTHPTFFNPFLNPFLRRPFSHSGVFRNLPLHPDLITPTLPPFLPTPSLNVSAPAPPNLFGSPVTANPFVGPGTTLGQLAYNTSALSTPSASGFSPYLSTAATGPLLASYSSGGLGNPYLGGAPNLTTSPYGSSSTSPYQTSSYGGGGYGSSGHGSSQDSLGAALQGEASLTRATGQYGKDIGEARLTREKANQAALDTERRRIELQRWYESTKLTAPQMRQREMTMELARARKNPAPTEIWSGKALNALLKSIQHSNRNPAASPALDEGALKQINLTDGTWHGNVGMFKDGGNLDWPETLKEAPFDKARGRLSRNLRHAVGQLQHNEPLEPAQMKDINADFKELNKTFDDGAGELSPRQYIETKRYLNQLSSAIKALSAPKVANYFNHTWSAKGKNVAELVAHLSKEGLTFAPAAPGEEAAYNALYLALRNYEASLPSALESVQK
jgi:hypothetical protein